MLTDWMRAHLNNEFLLEERKSSLYKNQSRALKTNLCRVPSVIHKGTVVEPRI